MPEVVLICPLCGGGKSREFDQRKLHGIEVNNRICSSCGLVFQSPRMSAAEIDQFYAAEYRQLYQGQEGPSQKDIFIQKRRAENLIRFLRSQDVKKLTRHLDIGSSAGELILSIQGEFNTQAWGVELGNAYRSYCRSQGLTVYPSLDELQKVKSQRFDLISLIHVLEHLPDPVNYLAQLRLKWLDPEGWLLLEVPNLYAHDCFEIAHLVSYSKHTLSQVVQKAGFEPVAVIEQGMPRSEVIPLYITILAKAVDGLHPVSGENIMGETMVRQKRRLGLARRRFYERMFPKRAWLPLPSK